MGARSLSAGDFDAAIANGKALVDFWASWCGPCKQLAPVIEELAGKYEGIATIAKVSVEEESALAARFRVMSIPTVILFVDGKEEKRFVGVQPIATYEGVL